MIFVYLSSRDLIQTFSELNSARMRSLLSNSVAHLDLVPAIPQHLRDQSIVRDWLVSLRLSVDQAKLFAQWHLSFPQVTSVDAVDIEDNSVLRLDLLQIFPLLRSLSLIYSPDDMSHDDAGCLARILFNNQGTWQQQLQSLSIHRLYLPLGYHSLSLMSNLRHLTINLRFEYQLFELCVVLPPLETCCVDVLRPVPASSDTRMNRSDLSTRLNELTIGGSFSSCAVLYEFILLFRSSLEKLKLKNITHADSISDEQMRRELLEQLPSLVRFQIGDVGVNCRNDR